MAVILEEGLLDPNAVVFPVLLFHQYVFPEALSVTLVQGSLLSGAKGLEAEEGEASGLAVDYKGNNDNNNFLKIKKNK